MLNERYFQPIINCISLNSGRIRLLDELVFEINDILPKGRRMTKKEIANLFVYLRKKGENGNIPIKIKHEGPLYSFY